MIQRNSYRLDPKEMEEFARVSMRNKIANLHLFEKSNRESRWFNYKGNNSASKGRGSGQRWAEDRRSNKPRKRNKTAGMKRKITNGSIEEKEESVRRKGISLNIKGIISSSLNSLKNLRESLSISLSHNKEESMDKKDKSSEKKDDMTSSLVQSNTLQTNMTIVNSHQSNNTLLTHASNLEERKIVSQSMEPCIQSPKLDSQKQLTQSIQLKEDEKILKNDKSKPEETNNKEDEDLENSKSPSKKVKRVHFAEEDILSESSYLPTSESDNSEVWFNDTTRTTMLTTFFDNEENIVEFIVTIYALMKYFNKSYYISVVRELPKPNRELLEPEISKISDELMNQVDLNRLDQNMAESNYLIVIQRDLEDTQIRLGETERLLKQQQTDYTDLEIEANNLMRKYEEVHNELGVMRRIHEMMQEEIELGGIQMDEMRYIIIEEMKPVS